MEKFISEYRFLIDVAGLLFLTFLLVMFIINNIIIGDNKRNIKLLKIQAKQEEISKLELQKIHKEEIRLKDLEVDKYKHEIQRLDESDQDKFRKLDVCIKKYSELEAVVIKKEYELKHLAMIIRDLGKKYAEIDALLYPEVDKRVLNGMKQIRVNGRFGPNRWE